MSWGKIVKQSVQRNHPASDCNSGKKAKKKQEGTKTNLPHLRFYNNKAPPNSNPCRNTLQEYHGNAAINN